FICYLALLCLFDDMKHSLAEYVFSRWWLILSGGSGCDGGEATLLAGRRVEAVGIFYGAGGSCCWHPLTCCCCPAYPDGWFSRLRTCLPPILPRFMESFIVNGFRVYLVTHY